MYGVLYIVATPIGNLNDISDRAKQTEYLSNSDGNIYLSWEMYENSTSNNKFHLDGGIVNDQLTRLETDKSKKHKNKFQSYNFFY